MHNKSFSYRADIDGLRAVAVVAVVLYHAFPDLVPGGFVGVDVFFVISGYLITNILQREVSSGHFSIAVFYGRRVRRLFPVLILVLAVTLCIGWAVLLGDEYRSVGWHSAAGAAFVANIALWEETGYFDTDAELKPLLHLWSLGIEEQFYLIWPWVVFVAYRGRINLLSIVLGMAIPSFAINFMAVESNPEATFFLPHARFWELYSGALIAIVEGRRTDGVGGHADGRAKRQDNRMLEQALASIGILAIILSVLAFRADMDFPGWYALVPVAGAMGVIAAGTSQSRVGQILSSKPVVYVGLISYPLYLWHWPLLSMATIVKGGNLGGEARAAMIVAALIFAIGSYHFLEIPLRRRAGNCSRSVTLLLCTTMALTFLLGVLVYKGLPSERLKELSQTIVAARSDWSYPGDAKAELTGKVTGRVLFFGDSYVQQYFPRMQQLSEDGSLHLGVVFHTAAGCAPVPDLARMTNSACDSYAKRGFELAMHDDVKAVVIAGSWLGMVGRGDYFYSNDKTQTVIDFKDDVVLHGVYSKLEREISGLRQAGKTVFLVLNPPGAVEADPGKLRSSLRLGRNTALPMKSQPIAAHLARTERVNMPLRELALRQGAKIVDPAKWLCSEAACYFSDSSGTPRFKDGTHFRATYVRECITEFDSLVLGPAVQQERHGGIEPLCRILQ